MNLEEHKKRHLELHNRLDELVADYIGHTDKKLLTMLVIDLIEWSYSQVTKPDEHHKSIREGIE